MSNQFSFNQRLLLGLTLFSMFFGAGNLIFPPYLGSLAGVDMPWAMAGFAITAVCFPILGVMTVARSGGLMMLASRVHPQFAFIFTLLIYLSIGPCVAIPRTASTSFEMALAPLFTATTEPFFLDFSPLVCAQFLYSVFFFGLAGIMALNPEKLTQRLGKVTSPALIIMIALLFLACLFRPIAGYGLALPPYDLNAFVRGFLEGYQTMDTLAALNFGLIIALNVQALGVSNTEGVVRETVKAGMIAGFFLITIYLALAHIGARNPIRFLGHHSFRNDFLCCLFKHLCRSFILLQRLFHQSFSGSVLPRLASGVCALQHGGLERGLNTYSQTVYPGIDVNLSGGFDADYSRLSASL